MRAGIQRPQPHLQNGIRPAGVEREHAGYEVDQASEAGTDADELMCNGSTLGGHAAVVVLAAVTRAQNDGGDQRAALCMECMEDRGCWAYECMCARVGMNV